MVTPNMISQSLKPFHNDNSIKVINLMAKIETQEEFIDANEVKVVVDQNSNAIYFSREPIPSQRKGFSKVPMMKQVCVIPFRRDYLIKFNNMEETELETIESIDMLRIIENGEKVKMVFTNEKSYSVDTEEDLINVENKMEKDNLMKSYINI